MLKPKFIKFRKAFKNKFKAKKDIKKNNICFGMYGLKSLENGRITARQIESTRRTMINCLNRKGKIWIRIFPDKPVSKKPLEIRMGKGKGDVSYWCALVKPGTLLYEISSDNEYIMKEALRLAGNKLGVKTKIVKRK